MSGGAPKSPRMATLEKWNKTREKKDPEFRRQQNQLRQSFFAPVVRTSGNPSTHAGTLACITQTVSAAPTAATLPTPPTPSFRIASQPATPSAIMLPKSLTPALGPESLPSVADEITEDAIPPISTQSGGASHLQQHNSPDRPFLLEDGFIASCPRQVLSYPSVPKTRAERIDEKIYFNHATQRPVRWKARAKDFFCVCPHLVHSAPC